MPKIVYANNAESTLAGAIATSATAIPLQSGHGALFPTLTGGDWAMVTLIKLVGGVPTYEIVRMTGKSGDSLTVVRAQEGTTALTFASGDRVQLRVTAGGLNDKASLVDPVFTGLSNNGKTSMNGSATALAALLVNAAEKMNIVASAANAAPVIDYTTGALWYFTTAATANWTFNVRGNASNTLNSLMQVGETVTVSMWATQGATAYYASAFQVDGVAVVPKWIGTAPTAGNVSGIDIYTYTIVKTGNAAFTVIATMAQAK